MPSSNISEWRQCSCITLDDISEIADHIPPEHVDNNGVYILLTHSCSISLDNFEKEPYAEYILARPIKKPDPAYCGRNNPRVLHIQIKDKWFAIAIHERGFFDRKILNSSKPHSQYVLSEATSSLLVRWITARYDAPAFPDEFNRRLNGDIRKRIAKKLKSRYITGIYVILEPEYEELGNDNNYAIELVISTEVGLPEEDYNQCKNIGKEIEHILDNVIGLQLEGAKVSVISEQEITVADLREMRLLQFDYLSERKNPGGVLPTKM